MSLNLFTWIREGVRQSVLAGVSDAIDQLGPTVDGDDLRPRMAETMRRNASDASAAQVLGESRPKRLGRTLKDLERDTGK